MLTTLGKYKTIAADLASSGFGLYADLLHVPLHTIEEWRAVAILQSILKGA